MLMVHHHHHPVILAVLTFCATYGGLSVHPRLHALIGPPPIPLIQLLKCGSIPPFIKKMGILGVLNVVAGVFSWRRIPACSKILGDCPLKVLPL